MKKAEVRKAGRHAGARDGATYRSVLPVGLLLLLGACASRPKAPPQVPSVVEVKVPLPVPCEIEQVPVPNYPAAQARRGLTAFELAKIVAADRRVRMGEIERLRAAAKNPCPAPAASGLDD